MDEASKNLFEEAALVYAVLIGIRKALLQPQAIVRAVVDRDKLRNAPFALHYSAHWGL